MDQCRSLDVSKENRLWLDLRTVLPRQDQRLVETVAAPANCPTKNLDEPAETLTG